MATSSAKRKAAAKAKAAEALERERAVTLEHALLGGGPAASAAALSRQANLYEVRLPAGDVGSINVGFLPAGPALSLDPATWLSQGYDGVRIIGAGMDRTHVRCTTHDGITIAIGTQAGIVQLEGLTWHSGASRGLHAGIGNPGYLEPKFLVRCYGVRGVCDPVPDPSLTGRPFWPGLFTWSADQHLADCEFDGFHAAEHDDYVHNVAQWGVLLERVKFKSSGGENFKAAARYTETKWPGRRAWYQLKGCTFQGWYQPWSNRGGGAAVFQGTGAQGIILEDCLAYGGRDLPGIPGHLRSRTYMVTSEGEGYDCLTGGTSGGFGNGWVIIRRSGAHAPVPAPSWWSDIIRCGREGGSAYAARGLLVEGCGVYGQRYEVSWDTMPADRVRVRACNTPTIRKRCENLGMDTTFEAAHLTAARPVPLSEGFAA